MTKTVSIEETRTAPTTGNAGTMQAVVQDGYGATAEKVLRFARVTRPTIDEDEVLVEVRAASVDRGTWHLMAGVQYPIRLGTGLRRPRALNPGHCFAGVVAQVGQKVTGFHVGDHVYGTGKGSFAEFVTTTTKKLALMPGTLSYEQAAAVPVSGVTALQALRNKGRVVAGDRVLVLGASGGVGSFAVQLAKASGAVVTGVASSAKIDLVRSLGADHVIDYQRENFADRDERYDVIIDTGGNSRLSDLRRVLTPKGRLVTVGGESEARWIWPTAGRQFRSLFIAPFTRQKLRSLFALENAADLVQLGEMIEAHDIAPAIDRTFELRCAASAIHYVYDGHARGKVVVVVGAEGDTPLSSQGEESR